MTVDTSKDKPTSPNEHAFSLIEMLVVLAILALVATLSMPAFRGRDQSSLSAVSLRLTTDLRAARAKAIASGRTTTVRFDPKTKRYFSKQAKIDRRFPKDLSFTITSAQLANHQKQNVIAFFSDGSSSGGSVILEKQGMKFVVSSNWLSGAITAKTIQK